MSSVGVMYCSSGPNTGSNPGRGQILKKTKALSLGLMFRAGVKWHEEGEKNKVCNQKMELCLYL